MRRLERGRLKETLHPDQRGNLPVFDVGITVLGVEGGGIKTQKHVCIFFAFQKDGLMTWQILVCLQTQ